DAADAFEAGSAEENIGGDGRLLDELRAEGADTGPGIEDHFTIAAGDLKAGGVSAITDGFASRTGYAAPHAPKLNLKHRITRQILFPLSPGQSFGIDYDKHHDPPITMTVS
ncbi:MAG: hypothetical protein O7C63_03935, partial [Alphaproteobacteria bacterium]|nr:hypothetical protein [Alphaproteobacteria bacterium]